MVEKINKYFLVRQSSFSLFFGSGNGGGFQRGV